MHRGQVAMWDALSGEYDGVNRTVTRMYVKKCAVCQQRQKRQHKAALVPITALTLYERVVIDLIDFSLKPSHGFKYIFHAVDHYSKYHWCWALRNKKPSTVGFYMSTLLACTGPIKHVQCDQGKEFVGALLKSVAAFGCGRVCNSSAFHPQTNGVVERYNGVFKEALEHWFIQENSTDWYPPLDRIRYQLNCSRPRTTATLLSNWCTARSPPQPTPTLICGHYGQRHWKPRCWLQNAARRCCLPTPQSLC